MIYTFEHNLPEIRSILLDYNFKRVYNDPTGFYTFERWHSNEHFDPPYTKMYTIQDGVGNLTKQELGLPKLIITFEADLALYSSREHRPSHRKFFTIYTETNKNNWYIEKHCYHTDVITFLRHRRAKYLNLPNPIAWYSKRSFIYKFIINNAYKDTNHEYYYDASEWCRTNFGPAYDLWRPLQDGKTIKFSTKSNSVLFKTMWPEFEYVGR